MQSGRDGLSLTCTALFNCRSQSISLSRHIFFFALALIGIKLPDCSGRESDKLAEAHDDSPGVAFWITSAFFPRCACCVCCVCWPIHIFCFISTTEAIYVANGMRNGMAAKSSVAIFASHFWLKQRKSICNEKPEDFNRKNRILSIKFYIRSSILETSRFRFYMTNC